MAFYKEIIDNYIIMHDSSWFPWEGTCLHNRCRPGFLLPSSEHKSSLVHTLTSKCTKLLGLYEHKTCVMFK